MTEEKLDPKAQKASIRRILGLVLALLALFVAAIWLFRQPIAEAIARGVCGQQQLVCKLSITRLDFGGLSLTGVDARGPDSREAALTATGLTVDLAWDGPFSPRPVFVRGDEVVVQLDLTGKRPLLGDLDTAITYFTKPSDKSAAQIPRIDIKSLRVIGQTDAGAVEARGHVTATGPDASVMELVAPATAMSLYGATMQLSGGQLRATIAGKQMSADAKLGLASFKTSDADISDVKIDASLTQVAGVLKGSGAASIGGVALKDTRLAGAQANASIESAAVDPAAFNLSEWLASVRTLAVKASAGEGDIAGMGWKKAELVANIEPKATGGSGGTVTLSIDNAHAQQGMAGRVEFAGHVDLSEGSGVATATGQLRIRGAALSSSSRKSFAEIVSAPLDAALPSFGAAAYRAANRAADNFEVTVPMSALASKGFEFSLLGGSELKSASGLMAMLTAPTGQQNVATIITHNGGSWTAAGSLRMSGGGGPPVSLDLAKASGQGNAFSLAGAASLQTWKVGSDSVSAEATGLEFQQDGVAGKAAGQLTVRLDGALGGGVWKDARGTGKVSAVWDAQTFAADAPRGAVIEWDQARYGETTFGKGALHYTAQGRLAERQGDGLIGKGTLAAISLPVTGENFSAKTVLGETGINWRAASGFRANFNSAPSTVEMTLDKRVVPIRIADINGTLDLRDGWRVNGGFSGGEVKAEEATVADLAGKFNLGGRGDTLDGSLSDIAMRIFDPLDEEHRRFEEAKFEGSATLKDSVATFTSGVAMAKSGMQVVRVTGTHSLETNRGSLTFEPTPLIFAPKRFQPYDLSPLLRGPANVTGRVDISGGASWSEDGMKANATADLRKIGFALATAGVFEGVSGKVVIADLLNLKSAPGQTITLDKVTLGLPIDNGAIRFQLIGYEAIRLESAEWPFVGGFIRVKPTDFRFGAEDNRVVAQAVDWDLAKIIEDFKVPDIKLSGKVSGTFPVVFSTGSATIDHAVLEASKEGGVIQYSGATGDAAAQAGEESKTMFEALKDFRFQVLKVGLNGDLADRMMMSLDVLGHNPKVLNGRAFQLNIGIDSALMQLLNSVKLRPTLQDVIETTKQGQTTGDQK